MLHVQLDGLVPWQKVITFLNRMDHSNIDFSVIECDKFPIMSGWRVIEDLLIHCTLSKGSLHCTVVPQWWYVGVCGVVQEMS